MLKLMPISTNNNNKMSSTLDVTSVGFKSQPETEAAGTVEVPTGSIWPIL